MIICPLLQQCIIRAFIIACAFFAHREAAAQLPDYHLQLFDHAYGIRPGNILATTRDKNGFLWILYPRSVQRFDGRQTKTFPVEGALEGLYCDEEGGVWVNTFEKVFRFVNDHEGFRPVPVPSKDTVYIGPLFGIAGRPLQLFTSRGIFRYDARHKTFQPAAPALPVAPSYSVRVFGQKKTSIFFAKGGQVYRYSFRTGRIDSLPDQSTYRILPLAEDSLLISTWNNQSYWYLFDRKKMVPALLPPQLLDKSDSLLNSRSIVELRPGRFLLAAREGVFEYNNQTHSFRSLRLFYKGLPVFTADYANHLFLDGEGYCWLSTPDGVARFSTVKQDLGFVRVSQANIPFSGAINNVRKLAEDRGGNLWLATGNGFVGWMKNTGAWRFYPPARGATDRLAYPSIRGMQYDGRYLILAPTNLGLWLFDPLTGKFRRPLYEKSAAGEKTKTLSEQDFFDDLVVLKGNRFLALGRDALYVLDGRTYTLRQVEVPGATENTNYAFQTGDGIVWMTTQKGMHCLDSNLNYLAAVPLPFKNKFISCGLPLPGNRLLFACADGLYTAAYNNGRPQLKKFTDLFKGVFLSGLYRDGNGIIWAPSENGIYRYEPPTGRLNLLDHSDNVQGYGFNGNSWFRNREGILFFGGINGFNYLRPETFQMENEALKVYIQGITINNNDTLAYALPFNPLLDFRQQSIEISFASVYFSNQEKIKYRYRLQGYDNDWKYLGSNSSIRFTSLPPGSYRLLLQASLNGRDWATAKNSFLFRIDAPYYLKWWFVGLCLLLFSGGVALILRNRNRKLQEKQEELEAEQAISFFATRMYEHNTVETILWDVAKNCIGRLQFEDCVIYLLDEKRKVLVQKAAYGPKSPRLNHIENPIEIPLGRGITGSVALSGKPEVIRDTTKDPRYIVDDELRYSEITVPIVSDDTVLGVIDCEHSKKGFFTQKHLSILTTIASLCANKIVRAHAQEEKLKAEKALMATRQRMADAEMQALRAQMNPHFIFNCLNSINRYIVKSDGVTASLYLTRFAKLIRLILDNSNSKTVTLANELEALRLYIEMESIRFDKKYSYAIQVDKNIQQDSVYVPPLIIQPYVENAIWHGLLHKEEAGMLTVQVRKKEEGVLECVIEDNGVGREKARELRSKSVSTKKSLGMKLTEDRLQLLNQQAQQHASITVVDLKNENGEAAGTRVVLNIPVE